jgi:hypothetical protein
MTMAYTLEQAERDLRNVYFMIRACRVKNWKHNNKAKWIKEAMRRMGVKRHELIDASYCLRNFDCRRCNKNAGGTPCYEIGRRRREAALLRNI